MSRRRRCWLIALGLALGASVMVGGCGAEPPPLAPRPTEPLRLPASIADEPPVEGKGTCAPAGHPDSAFTACCAGRPCAGYCVLNTRTQVTACRCFDREGGCPAGQICCKDKGACATPDECFQARKTPER